MKIEIKHWLTGSLLFEGDFSSIAAAVIAAVKKQTYLKGAYLTGAYLKGAYLTGAYLTGADLKGADLTGAINLTEEQLKVANREAIPPIPVVKDIDKKIYAQVKQEGRLNMGAWHTCGTTHCRGGWAITLAGESGKRLEAHVGSHLASVLIYRASRPGKPVPNFFANNADAMADIKKCATSKKKA